MTQVICISRGTQSGGRELADQLAAKLDYACLGREELNEAATQQGIQVGKLEMAMVRPGIFSERLALERDHYLAFTTAYLCDKAMEGGLVYHGRTGHFLLPGVSHVLKVRVLADPEYRIKAVMGISAWNEGRPAGTSTMWTRIAGAGCAPCTRSHGKTRPTTMSC